MSCRAALDPRLSLAEVPMTYAEREGRSKLGVIRDGIRFLRVILEIAITYRPLLLFGAVEGVLRWSALFLTGALLLSTTPVMLALVQEQAGRHPAAANGIFMMISFIARSAIVVVVGWIADRVGLAHTYVISAFCGLAGLPFLLALPARPPADRFVTKEPVG